MISDCGMRNAEPFVPVLDKFAMRYAPSPLHLHRAYSESLRRMPVLLARCSTTLKRIASRMT